VWLLFHALWRLIALLLPRDPAARDPRIS